MTLTRRSLLAAAAMAAPLVTLTPALAKTFMPDGVAIHGTDPVAYFTEGRPTPGSADHEVRWNGATWRFASAENADRFEADPARYAPAYGGYCAWAAAQGYLADTDPAAWTIHDGRLFLNANRRIKRRFERDVPGFVRDADANWPGLKSN